MPAKMVWCELLTVKAKMKLKSDFRKQVEFSVEEAEEQECAGKQEAKILRANFSSY